MFIDSHCHLDFDCFKTHLPALLLQLKKVQVTNLIVPGTCASHWPNIIALADNHPELYYSLGVHPHFLDSYQPKDLIRLQDSLTQANLTGSGQCLAIGEIGLDKLIHSDMELQETVFLAQLAIADKFNLPIILHAVKTQSRVLMLLKQVKFKNGGVYHSFSGSKEIAFEFIKLGFKIGVGSVITYPRAKKTRDTISQLPLSSLVLETDAPSVIFNQQYSEFESPLQLITIFESLCACRAETPLELQQQLYINTKSIFSIIND